MAAQVFYPDHYNGAFIACPDPVDFRAYTNIDIYKDANAYFIPGANKQIEQPSMRDYLGHTLITQRGANQYEAALGDHGRSGEQYDIWQAVFSPIGPDGYPASIIDKQTGAIDHTVAAVLARSLRPHANAPARVAAATDQNSTASCTSMSAPTTTTCSTTPSICFRTF